MDLKKIFAARLAATREQRQVSQRQLAFRVGVSPRAVGQYEQGENLPSVEVLVALARALEVSTDHLLGLSDDPHASSLPKGGDTE